MSDERIADAIRLKLLRELASGPTAERRGRQSWKTDG